MGTGLELSESENARLVDGASHLTWPVEIQEPFFLSARRVYSCRFIGEDGDVGKVKYDRGCGSKSNYARIIRWLSHVTSLVYLVR